MITEIQKLRYICDAEEAIFYRKNTPFVEIEKEPSDFFIGFIGDIRRVDESYLNLVNQKLMKYEKVSFLIFSNSKKDECIKMLSLPDNKIIYVNSLDVNEFCKLTDICLIPNSGVNDLFYNELLISESTYAVFCINSQKASMEKTAVSGWQKALSSITGAYQFIEGNKYCLKFYDAQDSVLSELFTYLESDEFNSADKANKYLNVFRRNIYKDKLISLGFTAEEYDFFDKAFTSMNYMEYHDLLIDLVVEKKQLKYFLTITQSKTHKYVAGFEKKKAGFFEALERG